MEYGLNDIVEMKKEHPCHKSNEWKIIRMGADIRIKCLGCGASVLMPRQKFEKKLKKSETIKAFREKVKKKTATYKDANDFAIETGELLADAFQSNLSKEILPDGKMYYNIADRVIRERLEHNYDITAEAAVEAAAAVCKEKKARAIPLAVASAFHTKLMQPAADAFYEAIQGVSFQKPQVRFYSNVLGTELTDFSDMPTLLAKHIVSPVRFTQELAQMQADGADTFIEFGPKAVLTGLVKKTLKDVTAKNCESVDTLKEVMA